MHVRPNEWAIPPVHFRHACAAKWSRVKVISSINKQYYFKMFLLSTKYISPPGLLLYTDIFRFLFEYANHVYIYPVTKVVFPVNKDVVLSLTYSQISQSQAP